MNKEPYALVIKQNEITVLRGYLLPTIRVRNSEKTDISITLSADTVRGYLHQFPPFDPRIYDGRKIDNERLMDHVMATKRVPIHFLRLEQWKSLSDETGLPLTIQYSHADFESKSFEELEEFEIYAPDYESFETSKFNEILDFLHNRSEFEFLGKTEVYNANKPIEQEDQYHEFLWMENGETFSLTASIGRIEFIYKEEGEPDVIKSLCKAFALQVDRD